MSSPIVFMFAGQGSQYFQMGRGLYESGGTFARWMKYLDTFVLETFGRSVLKALYGDHEKSDPFVDTPLSHPAIFMVEVALAYELIERGIYPDMTLGVSMGSFAAAAVAGNLRVEDALTLVVRQADALVDHCSEGGMIAVLAKAHLYQQESLCRYSVIAAYNFESHFALSARTQHLPKIIEALRAQGVTFQSLPVTFAYHSPWIEAAQDVFESAARQFTFNTTNIPLVCCGQWEKLIGPPSVFLWEAIRRPIQFGDIIVRLEAKGPFLYLDVGGMGTLTTFLKYLLPANAGSSFYSVLTPYGRDLDNLSSLVTAVNGKKNRRIARWLP